MPCCRAVWNEGQICWGWAASCGATSSQEPCAAIGLPGAMRRRGAARLVSVASDERLKLHDAHPMPGTFQSVLRLLLFPWLLHRGSTAFTEDCKARTYFAQQGLRGSAWHYRSRATQDSVSLSFGLTISSAPPGICVLAACGQSRKMQKIDRLAGLTGTISLVNLDRCTSNRRTEAHHTELYT